MRGVAQNAMINPSIYRVAKVSVKASGLKFHVVKCLVAKVKPDLPQSKQIEVLDDKRGKQHSDPSEPEEIEQKGFASRIFHAPNHSGHGTPLPIEQQE